MKRAHWLGGVASVLVFASCVKSTDDAPEDQNANDLIGTSGSALTKGSPGAGNGDSDFCNDPLNPCIFGEGDCDSNAQCQDPSRPNICAKDIGARFGTFSNFDFCVPAHCNNKIEDTALGEEAVDCGGLCGACTCPTNVPGGECSPSCRCSNGQGDCDLRVDCIPGGRCIYAGGSDVCLVGTELASGRPAAQSSEFAFGAFPAGLALDNDLSNFTHTDGADTNSTWQVDLGSAQTIQEVWIQNRTSCCRSRLRDITVSIVAGLTGVNDFSPGIVVWTSPLLNAENAQGLQLEGVGPFEMRAFVPNRVGQFVRIRRTFDPDLSGSGGSGNSDEAGVLSLGEVRVFGP